LPSQNEYTERLDVEYTIRRIGNQGPRAQTGWVGCAVIFKPYTKLIHRLIIFERMFI
jgi:hypothetical protein